MDLSPHTISNQFPELTKQQILHFIKELAQAECTNCKNEHCQMTGKVCHIINASITDGDDAIHCDHFMDCELPADWDMNQLIDYALWYDTDNDSTFKETKEDIGGVSMPGFTTEELNLIYLYDPGSREGAIHELRRMLDTLMPDEVKLKRLAKRSIYKLVHMDDLEYERFSDELYSQYDILGGLEFIEESAEVDNR